LRLSRQPNECREGADPGTCIHAVSVSAHQQKINIIQPLVARYPISTGRYWVSGSMRSTVHSRSGNMCWRTTFKSGEIS
ncbi:MAG: hypothetical protein OXH76_14910, partial [Boseongicola sp.]|nr:hypothetical protein [Boseongicola sp.]